MKERAPLTAAPEAGAVWPAPNAPHSGMQQFAQARSNEPISEGTEPTDWLGEQQGGSRAASALRDSRQMGTRSARWSLPAGNKDTESSTASWERSSMRVLLLPRRRQPPASARPRCLGPVSPASSMEAPAYKWRSK